jgi:hypothetical protein
MRTTREIAAKEAYQRRGAKVDAHDDSVNPRERVVGIAAGTTPRKRFLNGAQIGDFVRVDASDWRDVTPSAAREAKAPADSPQAVVAQPVLVVDEGSVVVARPPYRPVDTRFSASGPSAPPAEMPAARAHAMASPSPGEPRSARRSEASPQNPITLPREMGGAPIDQSIPPVAFEEPPSIPRRRAWPLLAVAGAVALAAAALFPFWPRSGEVLVRLRTPAESAPDEVEIFLAEDRVCSAVPCRLGDLAPGTYELKAVAPGRPPVTARVTITAGVVSEAWLELPLVQRLAVDAGPPGARLTVDGVDRGPLPAQIDDLTPGRYTVRITAPGHRPFDRDVDLAAGQRLDLGLVALEAAPAAVAIDVETAGAYVVLIDAREHKRVLRGPWPLRLELDPGSYQLLATRRGFVPFVAPIEATAGREASLRVILRPTKNAPAEMPSVSGTGTSSPPSQLPADIADDIQNPYADRL